MELYRLSTNCRLSSLPSLCGWLLCSNLGLWCHPKRGSSPPPLSTWGYRHTPRRHDRCLTSFCPQETLRLCETKPAFVQEVHQVKKSCEPILSAILGALRRLTSDLNPALCGCMQPSADTRHDHIAIGKSLWMEQALEDMQRKQVFSSILQKHQGKCSGECPPMSSHLHGFHASGINQASLTALHQTSQQTS